MNEISSDNKLPSSNQPSVVQQPSGEVGTFINDRGRYPDFGPANPSPQDDQGFEFYRYVRIATKYKWLVLSIVAAFLALATVFTWLTTPIFQASTTLQIDREQLNVVKVDSLQPGDQQLTDVEFYQTQYELLGSRSLAERVVANLGLADNERFNFVPATPVLLLAKLLHFGNSDGGEDTKTPAVRARRAADKLQQLIGVKPVRGSKLVRVTVDNADPELAKIIVNGFAQVFITDNLERRYDATSYARKFLEDHIAQLRVKLADSEKQMVKYAEAQGIIVLDDNKNLTDSDLAALNAKLSDAHAERIKSELLWNQAKATPGLGLKEILDNPTIQEDLKQRAVLNAQYELKAQIFKPAYPEMLQLRGQIKELDRQIDREASAIRKSLESSYLALKNEESTLQARVDSGKASFVDQQNKNIQYNILKREVDTNRTLYDGLLQRYKEIDVAGGVGTNNISVIDPANAPIRPRSPILWQNLLIAALLGLVVGSALAIGVDYLDDTFKSPEDVERELGLSVLGIVPRPSDGNSIEVELANNRSGMVEAYRSLRTGLQFSTRNGLPRTLLVTSGKPSEGKTTSTINLARGLAQIGLNVLLIDCDLRKASVHRFLGVSNELGLSNYLSGAKTPEEVVQTTDMKGLVLMTAGPMPPNPAELLSGPKLPSLLAIAAESFDVVMLDGPPVMGLADAPLLSSVAQATLLVIAANETRRSIARVALRRLRDSHANVVGVLLNKFDFKEVGFGYGYGYGYGNYNYYGYGATNELTDQSNKS